MPGPARRRRPRPDGAFLVLLRAKGETGAEVAGLARAMLASGVPVDAGAGLLDIVGTGGDGIGSVNISTGATVIAAAAGGRKWPSTATGPCRRCAGRPTWWKRWACRWNWAPPASACLRDASIAFMYAPMFHPAMAAVAPVRRRSSVRTAFNLLGPLLNPARAQFALVGVYSPSIAPLMASALGRLGVERALVVHSAGMDELTPLAPALVIEAVGGVAASRTSSTRSAWAFRRAGGRPEGRRRGAQRHDPARRLWRRPVGGRGRAQPERGRRPGGGRPGGDTPRTASRSPRRRSARARRAGRWRRGSKRRPRRRRRAPEEREREGGRVWGAALLRRDPSHRGHSRRGGAPPASCVPRAPPDTDRR